jgi:predicted phage terminase large subunit-like protein
MIHELTPREYAYLLRNDLRSFIERSFYALNPQTRFEANWHIDVIAAKLEDCLRGKIRRLIVNLPPRSLKSHAITVALPAWLLGHSPSSQIICASYGQDLSEKHARDCRSLMMSEFYKSCFPTRLAPQRLSVNDFMTTAQGFRMATSVGGVVTGRGGDIIIIDDPLKPEEALSDTGRKAVNEWFDNTLLSRLNNKEKGIIIIVMQRLHQDDLVGHVLERGDWEVLNFPAIAEEDECHVIETIFGTCTFTRKAGEALHPQRESLESLRRTREVVGDYTFLSQYQQATVPKGGAMIKADWLRYYPPAQLPGSFIYTLQSWDTANKSGELNDYSVCTTWGVAGGKYYLLDVFRRRLEYPDLKRALWEQARRYPHPKVLIEDKGSGTQLIQELKREGLLYIRAYEAPAGTDKIMRLFSQSHHFESGKVMLPATASWLDDYRRELTSFPGSKHDDQVDSTSQALHYMSTNTTEEIWARLGRGF